MSTVFDTTLFTIKQT